MKYLFINSVAGYGSTGRIAADQCRELMKAGHECVLAFGRSQANCSDVPTVQIGLPLDYKLHGVRNRILDDHGFGSKAAGLPLFTAGKIKIGTVAGEGPAVMEGPSDLLAAGL